MENNMAELEQTLGTLDEKSREDIATKLRVAKAILTGITPLHDNIFPAMKQIIEAEQILSEIDKGERLKEAVQRLRSANIMLMSVTGAFNAMLGITEVVTVLDKQKQ